MTMRYLALIFAQLLMLSLASAQSYTIRVANNTNLRASYSLDSAILASARAGTNLQVGGRHNRWLQISRDSRTYWMASWVSHRRVEQTASTQTQPVANIDNCCFVDRQCAADQEWTAGYWAYQRNECPSGQQATPATAPAGQPIDNCCFVNRQCAAEEEWKAGYHAFQYNNQCVAEPPAQDPSTGSFTNTHRIEIQGSEGFRRQIVAGLNLLQSRAVGWYNYVISRLRGVRQDLSQNYVYADTATRWMVMDFADQPPHWQPWVTHIEFIAQALVHEACHMGQEASGVEAEVECIEIELKATLEFAPNSHWVQESREWLTEVRAELRGQA